MQRRGRENQVLPRPQPHPPEPPAAPVELLPPAPQPPATPLEAAQYLPATEPPAARLYWAAPPRKQATATSAGRTLQFQCSVAPSAASASATMAVSVMKAFVTVPVLRSMPPLPPQLPLQAHPASPPNRWTRAIGISLVTHPMTGRYCGESCRSSVSIASVLGERLRRYTPRPSDTYRRRRGTQTNVTVHQRSSTWLDRMIFWWE